MAKQREAKALFLNSATSTHIFYGTQSRIFKDGELFFPIQKYILAGKFTILEPSDRTSQYYPYV